MTWIWVSLSVIGGLLLVLGVGLWILYLWARNKYIDRVVRCFQESPLFIIPRGQSIEGCEDVRFKTADGLTLAGCYLPTSVKPRQGVILFGTEFGSNRWAFLPYCEYLVAHGFDVFSFEPRNQGDSERQPGYEPLQWVTDFEVKDMHAALAYLKSRPDADPRGVGLFGISKGGSAGLLAAARDTYVRCFAVDGIFATYTTMVPYMRKFVTIYNKQNWLQDILPDWFYGLIGRAGLHWIREKEGCRFPHLERAIRKLSPRPLLMVHGGGDTYIKPDMARALFDRAGQPKEFWLVEGAKHNQALTIASDEYKKRVLEFFQAHLSDSSKPRPEPALAGSHV